jgi:hypothetical protein
MAHLLPLDTTTSIVLMTTKRIYRFVVGLALLTIALWIYASFLPAYTDAHAKTMLDDLRGTNQIDKKEYYERLNELSTYRNSFLDITSGLLMLGLTVGFGIKWLQWGRGFSWRQLPAPSKARMLFWFNSGWVLLFAGMYWYYMYRSGRGDYPPFADSIGIPLMEGTDTLLFYWPILNGLLLLGLWGAELPSILGEKPYRYTWRAILVEVGFGLWTVLLLLLLVGAVMDGDHLTIPVEIGFLYLLAALRAGQMRALNHKMP